MKKKDINLTTVKDKLKVIGGKTLQNTKQLYKNSYAESRKTVKTPLFIFFVIFICFVSVLLVVLDNSAFKSKLTENDFQSELATVDQSWIDILNENAKDIEGKLKENLTSKLREELKIDLKNTQNSVKTLQYLKDNDIKLYQNENKDKYYIKDYAYKFNMISIMLDGENRQKIEIHSDYKVNEDAFDANLLYFFIAVVLVVITFSDEFHSETIKLVVTRPMTRVKIGVSKFLSVCRLMTATWFIAAVIYLLFSLIFHNNVSYIAFNSGEIFTVSSSVYNIFVFIDLLLVSFGFVAVSMCISIRFKSSILAVIVPFIIYFFKSLLVKFLINLSYLDVFENLKLCEHFLFGKTIYGGTNIAISIVTSLGILFLLFVYAIHTFKKYDFDKHR